VEGDSSVSSLKNVSEDEGTLYDVDSELYSLSSLKPENINPNRRSRKMSQEVHPSKERVPPSN
jgi:hypothetical protein